MTARHLDIRNVEDVARYPYIVSLQLKIETFADHLLCAVTAPFTLGVR